MIALNCHINLQNIEDGKTYNLVMYVKSPETVELTVSLTSSDGLQNLASTTIPLVPFLSILGQENKDVCPFPLVLKGLYCCRVSGASNWTKLEQKLVAQGTNRTSRLQITTNKKGVVWFDQVSLMPADTYKVHYILLSNFITGKGKRCHGLFMLSMYSV